MSWNTIAVSIAVNLIAALDSLSYEHYIDMLLSNIKLGEPGSALMPSAYTHARDLPDQSHFRSTWTANTTLQSEYFERGLIWTHAYSPVESFEVPSQEHKNTVERVFWLSHYLACHQNSIHSSLTRTDYPYVAEVRYESRRQVNSSKHLSAARQSRSKWEENFLMSISAKTVLLAARQPKFTKH
jgi:hypothetical protein